MQRIKKNKLISKKQIEVISDLLKSHKHKIHKVTIAKSLTMYSVDQTPGECCSVL